MVAFKPPVDHLSTLLKGEPQQRSNSIRPQIIVVIKVQQPAPLRPPLSLITRHGAANQMMTPRIGVGQDALSEVVVANPRIAEPTNPLTNLRASGIPHNNHLKVAMSLGKQRRQSPPKQRLGPIASSNGHRHKRFIADKSSLISGGVAQRKERSPIASLLVNNRPQHRAHLPIQERTSGSAVPRRPLNEAGK